MSAYGLQVVRGSHTVLSNVTFTIPRGSIVGLLGPSGCGKTTLLRSVVGVQQATAGHVQVLGHAAGAQQLRTRVGYVTQAPSVYADLTVLKNLRYFAAALGMRGRRWEDAVVRVVKEVDLAGYVDKLVQRLSGGQYSRVPLAVALPNQADLLVVDEPPVGLDSMVGLDPMVRRELWLVFQRLAAEGTTLLVSSHVMDEADRCDRRRNPLSKKCRLVPHTPREKTMNSQRLTLLVGVCAAVTALLTAPQVFAGPPVPSSPAHQVPQWPRPDPGPVAEPGSEQRPPFQREAAGAAARAAVEINRHRGSAG
ncbi:ABC transporter ATP-binding protein, partial [Streptomyces sp. NPDC057757]|uniref:ABC transporter ATP-binding protein n=1 Tax=Streptomyces sp. NPDC057757 TaxID=3346241 RepID=UPI003690C982